MPEFSEYDSAYIAFDPYPSFKGSATHITEVFQTLQKHTDKALLVTLPGTAEPLPDQWQPALPDGNYLQRGISFGKAISDFIDQAQSLRLVHYRDIWSGMSTIGKNHLIRIFEVNGFPSIELKERYSILPNKTIAKIRHLEDACLRSCDRIVCPSAVIADHLLSRGIEAEKIEVIANGAHMPATMEKSDDLPEKYLVYFGALQPWQGINIAVKAFKYLTDLPDLKLVICSSHKEKLARPLKKFIKNSGFEERVVWKYQLGKPELHQVISNALISLAPLTECERNLVQGCSPLKIYESMACQTAILASDIPVVREILTHRSDGFLVRPDRPADLARGIRILVDDPEMRQSLALAAYLKVSTQHTWHESNTRMGKIYDGFMITEPT